MPTYLYECENHGEFECTHGINDVLDKCPKCREQNLEANPPKRLIASTSFVLVGSSWAKDNYR